MKKIMTQLLLSIHNIEKMMEGIQQYCVGKAEAVCRLESDKTDLRPGEQVISYREDELMTVKEAMAELRISRWKIDDMRDKGQLTTIDRGSRVRLIKEEVQAAKIWYSVPKGKI